jgi:Domain of unknown function (DUF4386)
MASQRNTLPIARTASWTGGIALLLIAVLAGIGYAGLITPLITPGGADATARAIAGAESQFRVGILLLALSAVLDVVVAAALLVIFEPMNRMLATMAAWFRVAYSAVFVVAIAQLGTVPTMLGDSPRVMSAVDSYRVIWQVGLILFAAHLLLVGYLAFKAGLMRGALGVLLVIAGLGYLADGLGTMLVAGFAPTFATYTFIGEVVLIGWLLWVAIRGPKQEQQAG